MQRENLLPNAAPAVAAEWQPMYAPSREQAEADRAAAYAAGVPHGERWSTTADWWAACQSTLRHPFLAHGGGLSVSSCLSSFLRPALWHMIPCTTPASRHEGLPLQECYNMARCLDTTHRTSEAESDDNPPSTVPHTGYVPAGDKYKDLPTIELRVVSNLVSLQSAAAATQRSKQEGMHRQPPAGRCDGPCWPPANSYKHTLFRICLSCSTHGLATATSCASPAGCRWRCLDAADVCFRPHSLRPAAHGGGVWAV
jgi:hypothetical protein